MRKTAKRLAGWALTLLVVAVGAWSVCADSTVSYDSAARSLVFAPGSDHAPTDLFDSFKGLMPGDIRTQTVTVRNTAADGKAKLYLRSLGARPDSRALLSRLQLCVRPRGSIPLFEAPADQTAGLTDWVCLGTIYAGGSIDLDLTLRVSGDIGNDFQDAVGYLDWQFRAEELPAAPEDPAAPKTGERDGWRPYAVLLGIWSVLVLCLLAVKRRQKQKQE